MSKRQVAESECDRCYERILWARSSAGAALPLDIKPVKITPAHGGPFYILDDFSMICTKASMADIEMAIERDRSLYTNHVVTCVKRSERNA